jgi:hypothetical protein
MGREELPVDDEPLVRKLVLRMRSRCFSSVCFAHSWRAWDSFADCSSKLDDDDWRRCIGVGRGRSEKSYV